MLNNGYELVTDASKLSEIANAISNCPRVAVDLETAAKEKYRHLEKAALNPHTGRIRLLQIYNEEKNWIIDTWKTGRPEPVIEALKNPRLIKTGQNLKFDQKYCLHEWDLELDPIFDTMLASGLIAGGLTGNSHRLDALGARFLGYHGLVDKEEQKSDWGGELTKSQLDYAADDVFVLPLLREKMIPKLQRFKLINVAKIEFAASLPVAAMELYGLGFNRERWEELLVERQVDLEKHEAYIKKTLNELLPQVQMALPGLGGSEGINLNSPPQLLRALRALGHKFGIPALVAMTATNKDALKNVEEAHEVVASLLKHREAAKAISTYGDTFLRHLCEDCGRIHTSFWPLTGAGRYSSRDPNMQNIPRDGRYRACFIPSEGKRLVVCDWSQIELRVAAEVSGDEVMRRVYREGGDIHNTTGSTISGKDLSKLSKDEAKPYRQRAKAVNFGLCIAEGQLVLTNVGLVPIEQVRKDHLVWDGVEWVQHEGVVFMGTREVIEYDGLIATLDHRVFTDDGQKVPLVVAASNPSPMKLAVGANGTQPAKYDVDYFDSYIGAKHGVCSLPRSVSKVYDIVNAGFRHRFTVSGKVVSNCYGMGWEKLKQYAKTNYDVTMTDKQAQKAVLKYFELYEGIKAWHRKDIDVGQRRRFVRTLSGRIRFLDEDKYSEYLNTKIQGTAADMLKVALRYFYDGLKARKLKAKMCHMVHDEIIAEADPVHEEETKQLLHEVMVKAGQVFLKDVPVDAEPSSGDNWDAAK